MSFIIIIPIAFVVFIKIFFAVQINLNVSSFEIIELTSKEKLFEREKYWIEYYDSYNNGYNETKGGEGGPSLPGEKNPNSSLTEQEVQNIRTLLL